MTDMTKHSTHSHHLVPVMPAWRVDMMVRTLAPQLHGIHRVQCIDTLGHLSNLVGELTAEELQSNHHCRFAVTSLYSSGVSATEVRDLGVGDISLSHCPELD